MNKKRKKERWICPNDLNNLIKAFKLHATNDHKVKIDQCKLILNKMPIILSKYMKFIQYGMYHKDENNKINEHENHSNNEIIILNYIIELLNLLLEGIYCPHSLAFFNSNKNMIILDYIKYFLLFYPSEITKNNNMICNNFINIIIKLLSLLADNNIDLYVYVINDLINILQDICYIEYNNNNNGYNKSSYINIFIQTDKYINELNKTEYEGITTLQFEERSTIVSLRKCLLILLENSLKSYPFILKNSIFSIINKLTYIVLIYLQNIDNDDNNSLYDIYETWVFLQNSELLSDSQYKMMLETILDYDILIKSLTKYPENTKKVLFHQINKTFITWNDLNNLIDSIISYNCLNYNVILCCMVLTCKLINKLKMKCLKNISVVSIQRFISYIVDKLDMFLNDINCQGDILLFISCICQLFTVIQHKSSLQILQNDSEVVTKKKNTLFNLNTDVRNNNTMRNILDKKYNFVGYKILIPSFVCLLLWLGFGVIENTSYLQEYTNLVSGLMENFVSSCANQMNLDNKEYGNYIASFLFTSLLVILDTSADNQKLLLENWLYNYNHVFPIIIDLFYRDCERFPFDHYLLNADSDYIMDYDGNQINGPTNHGSDEIKGTYRDECTNFQKHPIFLILLFMEKFNIFEICTEVVAESSLMQTIILLVQKQAYYMAFIILAKLAETIGLQVIAKYLSSLLNELSILIINNDNCSIDSIYTFVNLCICYLSKSVTSNRRKHNNNNISSCFCHCDCGKYILPEMFSKVIEDFLSQVKDSSNGSRKTYFSLLFCILRHFEIYSLEKYPTILMSMQNMYESFCNNIDKSTEVYVSVGENIGLLLLLIKSQIIFPCPSTQTVDRKDLCRKEALTIFTTVIDRYLEANSYAPVALSDCLLSIGDVCEISAPLELDIFLWSIFRLLGLWNINIEIIYKNPLDLYGSKQVDAYDKVCLLLEKKFEFFMLIQQYPEKICSRLGAILLENNNLSFFISLFIINKQIGNNSRMNENAQVHSVLKEIAPYILPALLLKERKDLYYSFTWISDSKSKFTDENNFNHFEQLKENSKKQVWDNVDSVATHILLKKIECKNQDNYNESFLLGLFGENISLDDIISRSPLRLFTCIVWQFSDDNISKKDVKKVFQMVYTFLNKSQSNQSFLKTLFLGIMTALGTKLRQNKNLELNITQKNNADINISKVIQKKAMICVKELLLLFYTTLDDDRLVDFPSYNNIESSIPKIISTLKAPVEKAYSNYDKNLPIDNLDTICEAWDTFVKLLPDSSLEYYYSSIIISILPMFYADNCNDSMDNKSLPCIEILLDYLFIEKQNLFNEKRDEFSFALPWNNRILKKYNNLIPPSITSAEMVPIQLLFAVIINNLLHWNKEIVLINLKQLSSLLHKRFNDVSDLILGHNMSMTPYFNSEYVPEEISFMLEILLLLLQKEVKKKNKLLIIKCLGAFGAIDPARIPEKNYYLNICQETAPVKDNRTINNDTKMDKKKVAKHFIKEKKELEVQDLIATIIADYLLPLLPEKTDDIGFAIQELLKALVQCEDNKNYEDNCIIVKSDGGRTMTKKLKRLLTKKNIYNAVETYWDTNYFIAKTVGEIKVDTMNRTLYITARTYEKWIVTWTKHLIGYLSSIYVGKHDKPYINHCRIFEAIKGCLGFTPSTARFILPYVIKTVLNSDNSQKIEIRRQIENEILGILNGKSDDDQIKTSYNTDYHSKYHECVESIFSILDELREWLRVKETNTNNSNTNIDTQNTKNEENEMLSLEMFLSKIPIFLLAQAAYNVQNYKRSLQYYETYLRINGYSPVPLCFYQDSDKMYDINNRKDLYLKYSDIVDQVDDIYEAFNRKSLRNILLIKKQDALFAQKIYSEIEEPDGLSGLVKTSPDRSCKAPSSCTIDKTNKEHDYLSSKILECQSSGHWEEAATYYDIKIQTTDYDNDFELTTSALGSINCLMQLGHHNLALRSINGFIDTISGVKKNKSFRKKIAPMARECAWRLSKWDDLRKYINQQDDETSSRDKKGLVQYDEELAKCLLLLHENRHYHAFEFNTSDNTMNDKVFKESMENAFSSIISPFSAACGESYARVIPFLRDVHILHDINEHYKNGTIYLNDIIDTKDDKRIKIVGENFKILERILTVKLILLKRHHTILLDHKSSNKKIHLANVCRRLIIENYLIYAKSARKAYNYPRSMQAILNAKLYLSNEDNKKFSTLTSAVLLQHVKLLIAQGNTHEAVELLENDIQEASIHFDNKMSAKKLLTLNTLLLESGQQTGRNILENFEKVRNLYPEYEKNYFLLARYYERIYNNNTETEEDNVFVVLKIIENYTLSLKNGNKYLSQAMPRLLTHYFQSGNRSLQKTLSTENKTNRSNKTCNTMEISNHNNNKILDKRMYDSFSLLSVKQWYTCFIQIVSYINHANVFIRERIKKMIIKIMINYLHQTMWLFLGLCFSNCDERKQIAQDIVTIIQRELKVLQKKELSNTIVEGVKLFDQFIKLAENNRFYNNSTSGSNNRTVDMNISRLHTRILIPMTCTLSNAHNYENDYDKNQNMFISSFGTKALVMSSKEKPKKITIYYNNNNNKCHFLCKKEKNGDLRKDQRMMEFNNMINKLLSNDQIAKSRNLRLRTYSVTCLNEDSGLLEWVNNTEGLRSLITKIKKDEIGDLQDSKINQEIQQIFLKNQDLYRKKKIDLQSLKKNYITKVLSRAELMPRFHMFFLTYFPNPTVWFQARLNYIRSVSIWSIVGHIVGLGDRHLENILLDKSNGEIIHVDFDCLFDKALRLPIPEIVPFRLTRNLIDAFGMNGYEGIYRNVAQISLSLCRKNKEILLDNLETFLYDPLVEWQREGKINQNHMSLTSALQGNNKNDDERIYIDDTKYMLNKIQERLNGVYHLDHYCVDVMTTKDSDKIRETKVKRYYILKNKDFFLPLSVKGQVDRLIFEATNEENLAQMYIGWMPFL